MYQEICLVAQDRINWSFYHRKREPIPGVGGAPIQNVSLQIATQTGVVTQTIAQSVVTDSSIWVQRQGTGFTYTGSTGVRRLQFTSTTSDSIGNFLDGVDIILLPHLEFTQGDTSAEEDAATPTLPTLSISGQLLTPKTVRVQVTGGTAVLGTDFTTPSGNAVFDVIIPAGIYQGTEFPLGITVLNNDDLVAEENIELAIIASPGDYTVSSVQNCGQTGTSQATHTIVESGVPPSSDLVTVKTLASGDATPAVGDTVTFEIEVTNNGPSAATNVWLRDSLPSGLTATANNATVTAGSYTSGTNVWAIPTLAIGASATLTIEGVVQPGQNGQTITNFVRNSATGPAPATGDQLDPTTAGDDLTESVVVANDIIANDDDFSATLIPSTGGNTASVFANDRINGSAFANGAVTYSIINADGLTGVAINADGTLTVPSGAAPRTYEVEYQICDAADPANCDTAIATVVRAVSADLSITKTNTPGVNGEVDQANDAVISGATTTYTLTVTNNGPDAVTGAVVTDTPVSGLTCPGTNIVTIAGAGVPAGSFTIGDLTGPGITLAALANGQSATLTFACQVN